MQRSSLHLLTPLLDEDSKILILGSFPSVKSMERGFYYMHPQNRFYKVLSYLFNEDFYSCSIEEKIKLLSKYKIALYDVIESCTIEGSSDSKISNVVPADIKNLIQKSNINKIYINGKKAYSLFIKYHKELLPITYLLPSTSPANATYSLEKLLNEWKIIKEGLDG